MRTINENNRIIRTSKELTAYKSELLLAETEITFFQNFIQKLKTETIGDSKKSLKVAEFDHELKHFKRLIDRLISELNALHHDQAEDARNDEKLDKETFKDHQYFKGEMKDFENNYKQIKYLYRAFVADFEYLNTKI
jgi:predicted  nucleic acid-binding Zn-ribbon protein